MEIRILGPLEVEHDGREIPLGRGRQRALLAILVLHANEVVSADALVDELWGGSPPETASKALQGHVSDLRKALGSDVLRTRAPGYVLAVQPEQVDAQRFERLLSEARGVDPADASRKLRQALALWRGSALAEFTFDSFAQPEIGRLEDLRLTALEDRIEADLALGRHIELVPELEGLVAKQPLRERLHAQLMLALYRSGRQAEALAAFREARRTLVEELGLEPGDELHRLERAILEHDPALAAPARAFPLGVVDRPRRLLAVGAVLVAAGVAAVALQLTRREGEPLVLGPNSVGVIDPETNQLVAQIPVGVRPAALAVGAGAVWVANAEDGTVSRIDPETRRVVKTIGIGAPASDLAVGAGGVWVATGTGGTLVRIDPSFGAVIETLDLRGPDPIVPNSTFAVAAGATAVWTASGTERVLRVDPRTNEIAGSVPVRGTVLALAFGAGAVWAGTLDGRVLRIEPRSNVVLARIAAGTTPVGIAVAEGAVWVVDRTGGAVWRIDPATNSVSRAIPAGRLPVSVAVGEGAVWVADREAGTVAKIDRDSGEVVARIRVGAAPTDIAVGAGAVWVTVRSPAT